MFQREFHGFGIRDREDIEIRPTADRRADVSRIGRGSDSLELVIVVEYLVGLEGESGGKEEK
jgi:hypothetical protein